MKPFSLAMRMRMGNGWKSCPSLFKTDSVEVEKTRSGSVGPLQENNVDVLMCSISHLQCA